MAGQTVSPVNGQPVPRGRKFTSETASEAARKGHEKRAAKKSISKAFAQLMGEPVLTDKNGRTYTGAEAIANAIIKGAVNGNAKMVEIALALAGETPSVKVTVANGQLADLIDGLREPIENDLYQEATGADGAVAD